LNINNIFSPNRILIVKIAKVWCPAQAVKIYSRQNGGAYDDCHFATAATDVKRHVLG